MTRSRTAVALVALALAVPFVAWADPLDSYTATGSPAAVQPLSVATYTIALTNTSHSPDAARQARIGVPSAFAIDASSLSATTSAAGSCSAASWTPTWDAVNSRIDMAWPGDAASELCPGGTLTVAFQATAPSTEAIYTWTTQLRRDPTSFALMGSQPTVRVDGTPPPAPSINSAPTDPSNSSNASFSFSDSEGGVGLQCQLDGGGFSACTSPASYSGLGDGPHTFDVQAIDAAGNVSGTSSYGWTIDTLAPPTPSVDSGPPNPSTVSNASFTFSDTEGGVGFQCQLDGGGFAACTSPAGYSGLSDGAHTFQLKAVDAAGNSSTVVSYGWTIDTTPPTVTVTAKPADPSNDPMPSFGFSASESGSTFQCKLDDAAFSACASPVTYGPLPEGGHTFAVKATDSAGNTGPAVTYGWTIDLTPPPAPSISSHPSALSASSSGSFGFSDTEGGVGFQCQFDGGGFSACTSPKSYSGLGDGPHTFDVKAVDAAGNVSGASSYGWTIDTTPPPSPEIDTDSEPPNVTDSTSATFVFSDTDASATFRCRLDGGGFSACTSPKSYSGLLDGTHTFQVEARDAALNESPATSYTWTIDTVDPVVAIESGPANPTNQSSAIFIFSSNKPPSTYLCKLDAASFSSCDSPKNYSVLLDGLHSFQVKATDSLGNTGPATIYEWVVDTHPPPPPTFGGGPAVQTNATNASFVFSDSESGLSFGCQLDGSAFTACSSPATYSGLANGSHVFAVRGTDAAGNTGAPAAYGWTVDTVPPDTTISSGPEAVSASSSATFAFTSTEAGSSFACRVDTGAFAPCLSPQTYGGFADGSHAFQVRATDRAGNPDPSPATYTWTVDAHGVLDRTPPGDVGDLAKSIGYGKLKLRWNRPPDKDFDHVLVLVGNDRQKPPAIPVYEGAGTSYTDAKFRNGAYYRFAVVSYDHAGNASAGVAVNVPPSALLASPRSGAPVRRPPLLHWTPAPKATYYNVQLYFGSQKILSTWPKPSKLKLKRQWSYRGHIHRLKKGRYTWYVWPGFGSRMRGSFGQLLGQSSFVFTG